jgi:hypothetical protein
MQLMNSANRSALAIFDNVAVGVAVIAWTADPYRSMRHGNDHWIQRRRNARYRSASLAVPEDRGMDIDTGNWSKAGAIPMMELHVSPQGWAGVLGTTLFTGTRPEGKPDYSIGIIEDIDEQKRAQERFAEQEAEYLLTLQQRAERTLSWMKPTSVFRKRSRTAQRSKKSWQKKLRQKQ